MAITYMVSLHQKCNGEGIRKASRWGKIHYLASYRKISIISPGFIFVQKAFLLGLYSGELIFGGACYCKEFCVSKWVWLVNRNS